MFSTDPDKLREEVKGAYGYLQKHTARIDELVSRGATSWYRPDKAPENPSAMNWVMEYLALMVPQIAYGLPRCMIMAGGRPSAFNEHGLALQYALNWWADDDDLGEVFDEIAYDYLTAWGVVLMTSQDQPYRPKGDFVPQKPYAMRLSPHVFAVDPLAKTMNPLSHDGPRYMMHMWKADAEDLMKDKKFDKDAVKAATSDNDLEKYDRERSGLEIRPDRNEILAWDIWIPEIDSTDEPGYNGSIMTVGVGAYGDSQTKKSYILRDKRPCFCPPWGPYNVFGAYRVLDNPYPLSPLLAAAEQAEELNAHIVQAAEDAASFKRFLVGKSSNTRDNELVKNVKHGHLVTLDDPESVDEKTIGGTHEKQIEHIMQADNRLDRALGISDAMKGNVDPRVTATAESIAQSGLAARLAHIQKRYRKGVTNVFRSAAYLMWHGEDMVFDDLGPEAAKNGIKGWIGGSSDGDPDEGQIIPRIRIEPYSLEHTSQAILQRRLQEAFQMMGQTAPAFLQAPFMPWKQLLDRLFESMNMGEVEIDEQLLQQMAGALHQAETAEQQPEQAPGEQVSAGGTAPSIDEAQSMGNEAGAAHKVS